MNLDPNMRETLIRWGQLTPAEDMPPRRTTSPDLPLDAKGQDVAARTLARFEPRLAARIVAGTHEAPEWLRRRLARLLAR